MAAGMRQTAVTKKPVTAVRRLKQDYLMIVKDPVPYLEAAPLPSNILEWHYVIRGPEGSPYHKGIYHGKLRFPPDYPFKPPTIYMITPNGRFKPNTRLCLSISDFHPDTWNPTWNLSTILTGLLSFMLENNSTYGSIITTKREKQIFARDSWEYNLKDPIFCELFPHIVDEIKEEIDSRRKAENGALINGSDSGQTRGNSKSTSATTSATTTTTGLSEQWHRFWLSMLYNLIAVILLIVFFFIVRSVLGDYSSSSATSISSSASVPSSGEISSNRHSDIISNLSTSSSSLSSDS